MDYPLRPIMFRNRGFRRWAILALMSCALAACAFDGDDQGSSSTGNRHSGQIIKDNLEKAQALRAQGNYASATKILSQILLASPDDPSVIGEYGKVLVEQGRTAEAITFLNRAIMLSEDDWTLYSALGIANDGVGNSFEARNAYEHALKLNPGEKVVLNNYALSRLMAGDAAGAQDLIEQAMKGSKDPKIARNLALIESLSKTAPAPNGHPAENAPPKETSPSKPPDKKTSRKPTGQDFSATTGAPAEVK